MFITDSFNLFTSIPNILLIICFLVNQLITYNFYLNTLSLNYKTLINLSLYTETYIIESQLNLLLLLVEYSSNLKTLNLNSNLNFFYNNSPTTYFKLYLLLVSLVESYSPNTTISIPYSSKLQLSNKKYQISQKYTKLLVAVQKQRESTTTLVLILIQYITYKALRITIYSLLSSKVSYISLLTSSQYIGLPNYKRY